MPKIRNFFLLFYLFGINSLGFASDTLKIQLKWGLNGFQNQCEDCFIDNQISAPLFKKILNGDYSHKVFRFENIVTENISPDFIQKNITNTSNTTWDFKIITLFDQGKAKYQLNLTPFRLNENQIIEKILSFQIIVDESKSLINFNSKESGRNYASKSVLATGNWYKIGVNTSGIYSLDIAFLKTLGINIESLNPKKIRVFGQRGGMIPRPNSSPRIDDLTEIQVYVSGENDGSFNGNDAVVFYAEGPSIWKYDSQNSAFRYDHNVYSDANYYYININQEFGKRIETLPNITSNATQTSISFDDYAIYKKEKYNFLKSGAQWWGELFDIQTTQSFSFKFQNILPFEKVKFFTQLASRSIGNASSFMISTNGGGNILSLNIPRVTNQYLDAYANVSNGSTTFSPNSENITLTYDYVKGASVAQGWLGQIELNARRFLSFVGPAFSFRDVRSVSPNSITEYLVENTVGGEVLWDITDPIKPTNIVYTTSGNKLSFKSYSDTLRQFCIWLGTNQQKPIAIGKIMNQNLHGLASAELLIITHPDFISQSNDLAQHKISLGLKTHVVNVQDIYNEFAGGKRDITAIRDFIKMIYDRAPSDDEKPKYVLLMGDASYDYKNISGQGQNFVPTFESQESLQPTGTYCSDYYFALLDDSEGQFNNGAAEMADVSIGRIPVSNAQQAGVMVQKIKNYESSTSFGDWRNTICMVADDGDYETHMLQAEQLSAKIALAYPKGVLDKIYLDAYKRISVPGGIRYPGVNTAINTRVNNGALVVNFTGHGGVNGWTEERILTNSDINSWENGVKLPLFVTATCEFTRYDDPEILSAGEQVMLQQKGGAIAMLTTVRLTWSGENYEIATNFYSKHLFAQKNNQPITIGEAVRRTLNESLGSINTRSYAFLGDPSLTLAFPKQETGITHINNISITQSIDTLKALMQVNVAGEITDKNNVLLNTFNGVCYPTVYDKETKVTTLQNDPNSRPMTFGNYQAIIYKGLCTVQNGKFNFSFIVPRDISYNVDFGRINLYATNGIIDANGKFDSVLIGLSSQNSLVDIEGPKIRLFMNDTLFKSGDITNNDPFLLAFVSDNSGISTVGSGIGRDLSMSLDNGVPVVLNSFYESNLDSYQIGKVKYPFKNLSNGIHKINFKAWDVYNNSSEAEIAFQVNTTKNGITQLINYPNPFTDKTTFRIQHNQPFKSLNIQLLIYDLNGKLIQNFSKNYQSEGYIIDSIDWDGSSLEGGICSNGFYIAKIIVTDGDGNLSSLTIKLVKNR